MRLNTLERAKSINNKVILFPAVRINLWPVLQNTTSGHMSKNLNATVCTQPKGKPNLNFNTHT